MARQKSKANPALLQWARESARLDVDTAAARAGVKPDTLESWEAGTDAPSIPQLRKLGGILRSRRFARRATNRHELLAKNRKGANAADPWVIAVADVREAIVGETMTDSERRPKIPGVCKSRGIECINLLEFMRRQKWRI